MNDATLGELYINNHFFCFTLEDKVRDEKIKHETAIPAGKYEVVINFSERFKVLMPLLLNVPNYVGIRIHPGNSIADTSGCILVGSAIQQDKLLHSKATYQNLLIQIKTGLRKDKVFITVEDIPKPIEVEVEQPIISPEIVIPEIILKPDSIPPKIIETPIEKSETKSWWILLVEFIINFLKK